VPYPDKDDYTTLLFRLLDEFELSETKNKGKGHPYVYDNRSLICFFIVMTLKRCFAFKAMNRWLIHNQQEAKKLGFDKIPTRQTLSVRYKALYSVLQRFIFFIKDWASPLGEEFSTEIVYEDKSLFKAKGSVWHKKDMENNHIPEKLRDLDTDATWDKSAYRGWVFGYGLHITCTPSGFPILAEVDTASVSEHEIIKRKISTILPMNTGYLVGDDGYTSFKRTEAYAQQGLLLLTPASRANGKKGIAYHRYMERTGFCDIISSRKTVIEPLFNLIIYLLNTSGKDKELPLKGKLNVRSFLLLGVMLTQLAFLMNSIYGLDLHNVSHMLTVFL
jgi:Transposase DDE domain